MSMNDIRCWLQAIPAALLMMLTTPVDFLFVCGVILKAIMAMSLYVLLDLVCSAGFILLLVRSSQ
jgi:hypothetical protein